MKKTIFWSLICVGFAACNNPGNYTMTDYIETPFVANTTTNEVALSFCSDKTADHASLTLAPGETNYSSVETSSANYPCESSDSLVDLKTLGLFQSDDDNHCREEGTQRKESILIPYPSLSVTAAAQYKLCKSADGDMTASYYVTNIASTCPASSTDYDFSTQNPCD